MNPIQAYLHAANRFADEKNLEAAFHSLATAVLLVSERPFDPTVFRHEWTPEELAERERLFSKPLTLADLKRQVDAAVELEEAGMTKHHVADLHGNPYGGLLWYIGSFEIRRRK